MENCKKAYPSHAEDSASVVTNTEAPPGMYKFIFFESEVFQTLEFDSSIERNILPVILDSNSLHYWNGLNVFCFKMNADRKPLTDKMDQRYGVKNHNFEPIRRYFPSNSFTQQEYRHRGICAFISLIQCYADEPETPSLQDLSHTLAKLDKEEIYTSDGQHTHKATAGWRELQKDMSKKPHRSVFTVTGAPMTSFESIEPGAGFSCYSIVP